MCLSISPFKHLQFSTSMPVGSLPDEPPWWHTKSHPTLWGDWYAPETFPDAHVIYHAAWRGFWWHRPPDYLVEAGPVALVATVASRCIYNLNSRRMSNKWLWSGMIDMRISQKVRILQILSKRLVFLFKYPATHSETSSCWETTCNLRPFHWCVSSFCLADWN